jgi:hypothetical protein
MPGKLSTECSSTITRFVWDGDQILYEMRSIDEFDE